MIYLEQYLHYQNVDLITVGIAIAAIIVLGFLVYQSDRQSITNQSFLVFAFLTAIYGIFNYSSYKFNSEFVTLWLVRFTIFVAVWHSFSLFQFFYVFPEKQAKFSKKYTKILVPIAIVISLLALTPAIFSGINYHPGGVSSPIPGPAIPAFGILILFLILGGVINLFRKTFNATNDIKRQLITILKGTLITFTLILIFNLILPSFFNNSLFVPLAPVFILPFIVFTYYAIARYHLLEIKVITTEVLTFFLAIAILFEITFSANGVVAALRFVIFLVVLGLGIFLNRSVRKEVEQRQQLEILDKELEDANVKLKALDQARAEFITIASHQLRTPPATIKWYLSSILDGDYGKLPKGQLEILNKANRTNNSLISLIDDMLNVSRIERGKMEFLFVPANLLELAKITYEQLEPIAGEKHLKLIFKAPRKKPPVIMADKEKIRQVMNNLIDNALKYTREGSIIVSLSATSEQITFSVKDTGKGISPEEKKSIFEKYSRGKESIMQSAGLGLGLYVAKIIVEQHKGKIWAESEGEGNGSSFIFSLPINNGLKETTLVDLGQTQNQLSK